MRNLGLALIDEQLLQLLSPLEPLKVHVDVKSKRLEDTGTWLLELECFRKWCDIKSTDGSERILCCYGMPGAEKRIIRYCSAIVLSQLTLVFISLHPPSSY